MPPCPSNRAILCLSGQTIAQWLDPAFTVPITASTPPECWADMCEYIAHIDKRKVMSCWLCGMECSMHWSHISLPGRQLCRKLYSDLNFRAWTKCAPSAITLAPIDLAYRRSCRSSAVPNRLSGACCCLCGDIVKMDSSLMLPPDLVCLNTMWCYAAMVMITVRWWLSIMQPCRRRLPYRVGACLRQACVVNI